MIVANQETHLLPAQVVHIVDDNKYLEEISYFLPLGKAIDSVLITQVLEGYNIKIEYVD